jgi:ATP-GRASP peptide maturase of grasp-with-spasm system
MILISSTKLDPVTNNVIDWIYFYDKNKKVVRINDDNDYEIEFNGDAIYLKVSDERINFSEVESFWYRRGRIRYKSKKKHLLPDIKQQEEDVLEEYINFKLSHMRSINKYSNCEPNKLIVLELAKKEGLSIPKTYMIQDKENLEQLNDGLLITKNYLASAMFSFSDVAGIIYTTEVDENLDVPDKFGPSLIQENIQKKYELRIFYFKGEFWSMAIFSQSDEQTKSDFRIYNNEKPNRTVAYKLPSEIEQKLIRLMDRLDLDSGSIDMIVTTQNEFVFLEVNPIGQFGMVSYPCNYNIEKTIAKYLCNESR